jgi:hypothetical protein
MQYWMNHTAKRAILCAVICMGTFPFYEAPVHAAPTSTGGLTYTEETDSSGTTWYTFSSGTSTGTVAAVSGDHLKFSGVTVSGDIVINTSDTDAPSVLNSAVDMENTTVTGSVYAGYAVGGNATGNSAALTGNIVIEGDDVELFGGYTTSGDASNNVVNISDAYVDFVTTTDGVESGHGVYGGYIYNSGNASENEVIIDSSTVRADVVGGNTSIGNAMNNTVSISNSEMYYVFGGWVVTSGDASGNTVTISDSATDDGFVYGGFTHSGNAAGNTVSISSTSLEAVVGGQSAGEGDATGNTVILSDVINDVSGDVTVIGGWAVEGNSTNNTVTAANSDLSIVAGGVANSGNVSENTVEITSSTVGDEYGGIAFGGYVVGSGDVTDNTITITSSTVTRVTGGGYTASGDASDNTVTVTDSTLNYVYGGYTEEGNASNNTITATGSTLSNVYGGYSGTGDTLSNTLTLTSSTADEVYGGYTESGDASSNTLTISASTTDDVYGGYTTDGNATSNTVTLGSTVNVGDLYGGYTAGSGDVVTGNTLNVTGLNNTAVSIQNFDTMNFYVPAGASNGDTMLTVSGTTTIPSTGLTATAYVNGSVVLNAGDEITLLSGAIDTTDGALTTAVSGSVYQGVSKKYTADIETRTENDSDDYIKLIVSESEDTALNDQTKSLVETPTYTAALVASGGDFLVDNALWNAAKAVKLNSDWTWTPFVAAAYKNMRYNTGSHVESDGWNTILGIARRYEDKSGSFLVGPFVEYGNGDYDSYIDGGIHANGNAHYVGGGIFAQKNFNSGWYIDGSVRGGRVSADYNSDDLLIGTTKVHEDYDYRTPYYGFHLGFGKVHNYGDNVRLDTYLRYMYAHQNSFDAKLATGENYEFDDVDSSKIRVGTRYIHDEKDLGSWYVGAAYQYEFDNESTAHFDGGDTPSPSVQGSSGMMELGWEGKGGKNLIYDLSLRGWVGKEEGASVRALVKWTF